MNDDIVVELQTYTIRMKMVKLVYEQRTRSDGERPAGGQWVKEIVGDRFSIACISAHICIYRNKL